ncbi:hypothetical protein AGMMS49983_21580 [Clostridia bacterium]|nr:hypothetical protein AGMMS49983_21580 [Clostridia bacterium]
MYKWIRFFAIAALCLSLVFLTACGKADAGTDTTPPSDSAQSEDGQEQDESESDDSGFVIEDTSVVDVEIDEE